jgi:hypothetical protein
LRPIVQLHFFTHALVAESHFMSVILAHSALVFGASAANAGAVMPNRKPATIAVLRILDIVFPSKLRVCPPNPERTLRSVYWRWMSAALRIGMGAQWNFFRVTQKAPPGSIRRGQFKTGRVIE